MTLGILSLLLTSVPAVFAADRAKVDIDKPMVAALGKCTSPEQLDCIESVVVIAADGKRLVADQSSAPTGFELDENQQVVESGASTWEYKTASGVASSFILDATLLTPKYLISGSVSEVEVVNVAEGEIEGEEEPATTTETVSDDTRFFEAKLSISAIFSDATRLFAGKKLLKGELLEVVVRTSWLEIEEAFLPGLTSSINISPIKDGKRITLSGSEDLIYKLKSRKNALTGVVTSTVETEENFDFILLHPKGAPGQGDCYKNGFKVSATNGTSLSLAEENANNSLKFAVSGYAYKPDKSLVDGYAVVRVPLKWIACKFPGHEMYLAKDVSVKVLTTDSSKLVQNPAIMAQILDGNLDLKVEKFRFAKTEIIVEASTTQIEAEKKKLTEEKTKAESEAKARAEAEAKAKAEAEAKAKADAEALAKAEAEAKSKAEAEAKAKAESKKITISCVKGKTVKKITAVKPKCPKGFKKK